MMKKVAVLLVGLVIAFLAFMAGRATGPGTQAATPVAAAGTTTTSDRVEDSEHAVPPPTEMMTATNAAPAQVAINPAGEPVVVAASPATETTQSVGPPAATEPAPAVSAGSPRPLIIPVAGVKASALHDMFNEVRGNKRHEALDILAPRGTQVIAADDGVVRKLFTSVPGGLTVYEFDRDQQYCYYYAHLDAYAAGLHEGQQLKRGDLVGYVGTTGNAPKDTPHLHFALIRLDPDKRWWKGTYVDPYPLLR